MDAKPDAEDRKRNGGFRKKPRIRLGPLIGAQVGSHRCPTLRQAANILAASTNKDQI